MRLKQIARISRLEITRNKSLARKDFLFTIIPTLVVFCIIILTMMTKGYLVGDSFYRLRTNDASVVSHFTSHPKFYFDEDYDVQVLALTGAYYVDSPRTDRGKSASQALYDEIKSYTELVYSVYPPELAYPFRIETSYEDRSVVRGVSIVNKREHEAELDLTTTGQDLIDQVHDKVRAENQVTPEPSITNGEELNLPQETIPTETIAPEAQIAPELEVSEPQITEPTSIEPEVIEPQPTTNAQEVRDAAERSFITRDVEGGIPPSRLNTLHSFIAMYKAMLLIFPLTMIGIIYSNSLMSDRINRRIHVLLSAPVTTLEIIVGKTLPYLAACIFSMFTIAIRSSGLSMSLVTILAIAAIVAFLYCAIAFVVSMLARDSKELSFFMIFFLSAYSFILLIPTFLSSISNISLISPLTLIVRLFENGYNPTSHYVTLIPHVLLGLALYGFGAMLHNEENMLSYRTIAQKFNYGLSHIIQKPWHLMLYCAATVPLTFIIEMVLLLFLVGTHLPLIVMVLFMASVTEEALKCLGFWAVAKNRDLSNGDVIVWGFLGGLGFFLVEKASFLITIKELVEMYSLIALGGLLIPLLIHVGLAILYFALIKQLGKKHAFKIYWIVTLVHFLLNFNIVRYAL